jgi:GNAT superfamily N-acetyltransferase
MPIDIRRLTDDDWEVLKQVRLRALKDAPYAFASSYEREALFDEDGWRERLAMGAWFTAIDVSEAVGLAAGVRGWSEDPSGRELISMWVAESHRRQGVATALFSRVAAWARAQGAATLTLGVIEGNERARRAYRRMGLVETGRRVMSTAEPRRAIDVLELRIAGTSEP